MAATPYSIKVHNLESCNCNHGCGCQFNGYPDHGSCEAVLGFEVIEGHYGDVDLTGSRVVIAVKWPKAIHEGGGQAVLFVDEKLPAEKVGALAAIFSGQAGGMPWEALGATLVAVEGPVAKPIEMKVDGNRSTFSVPGAVEVRMTQITDVMSGEPKDVQIVFPNGGFIWDSGSIGTTGEMRVDHGDIQFSYPGRFAAYATPTWTNQ